MVRRFPFCVSRPPLTQLPSPTCAPDTQAPTDADDTWLGEGVELDAMAEMGLDEHGLTHAKLDDERTLELRV